MKKIIINKGKAEITRSFNDQFYKQNGALMEEHTVPVTINRYYTDVNGTIIDKALVPGSLQVNYPVYLFGQFDRNGGFKRCLQTVSPIPGTFFYMTFVQGISSPFLSFTGANTIKGVIKNGDVVIVYTDDLENPNYFIWIVISSDTVSFASIVANTETTQQDGRIGQLWVKEANYYVSTPGQFYEPIFFNGFDNIGNYKGDSIQPNMNLNPYVEQTGILTLTLDFKVDQYISMCFYMRYSCDQINLDFKVNKI